ncbi:MAG: hypothetical protein ACRC33_15320 [Gemmataceae bacterium]
MSWTDLPVTGRDERLARSAEVLRGQIRSLSRLAGRLRQKLVEAEALAAQGAAD